MHALLAVFRKEFRENLRDRRTLISALVFGPLFAPALFAAALMLMVQRGASGDREPLNVTIAHAERAPNLVSFLKQYGVTVERADFDETAARVAVEHAEHRVVVSIDGAFGEQFTSARPAVVRIYADASDSRSEKNAARVRALLNRYSLQIAQLRVVLRGIDPVALAPLSVRDVDVSTPASRSVAALGALSYIVLLTMLMGGLYLSIDATAGERERGSLEPLLTAPATRESLIYGKMLAAMSYMLLSLLLTVTAFAILLRFVGLERFGMSVNFGPLTALEVALVCIPLIPLGAALMTTIAAYTRSYREAQTYISLVLLIPTVPLIFASAVGLRPTPGLMLVPSLSQHFLITSLLRNEPIAPVYLALSVGATLLLGALLGVIAGRLYHREALLG